jgi:tetratricopeptide (TPR) repeat protein
VSFKPFPHDAHPYRRDVAALRPLWDRLHAGDAEPWPDDARVVTAWCAFHAGDFEAAVGLGLEADAAGAPGGLTAANKAQALYATHLEDSEAQRRRLLLEVAERASRRARVHGADANAWYSVAYALGRHAQSLNAASALAQGLPMRIRHALDTTLRLAPRHADALVALGAFHAEVIDKVGALLGLAQGASRDAGLAAFRSALKINPDSPVAMLEAAHGLVMLEGGRRQAEATRLVQAAAAHQPLDAAEHLDVERAKAELEE